MLTLTPSAVARVKELVRKPEYAGLRAPGLRVKVVGGGCAGLSYDLAVEDGPGPEDRLLELEGARVFVDPKSAGFLEGVLLDFKRSLLGAAFEFQNPKATGTCGCGSSFSV